MNPQPESDLMSSTYSPSMYDLVNNRSFGGDIEFYRELSREVGGPVLEIGAGTGRTLLPIARAGVDIVGIDLDEGMLTTAQGRVAEESPDVAARIELVQADMRAFQLDRAFPLVTIPFRAFLHNLTREDQLATLRCCHAHLEPGGLLAMNMFHPSLRFMSDNSGARDGMWRFRDEYDDAAGGGKILVSDMSRYDTARQTILSYHRYERFDPDGLLVQTHLQTLRLSYLYPGDLRDVLTTAGFVDVDISGGFDGGEFESDGDEMVVRAYRAPA